MSIDEISGVGLGIRQPHFSQIIRDKPNISWFELLADNYLCEGGKALLELDEIREKYPMTFHCVGMNLGGTDPLDFSYLEKVNGLASRYQAKWISDHLCWSAHQGRHHHDLLPLPYTEEAINNTVERITKVQDFLGERILIENASTYIQLQDSEMKEWEFLSEISQRSDCNILLDINNIYVNSVNHNFDPLHFLNNVPMERVKEFHLAGHEKSERVLIDTHGASISNDVWSFYDAALKLFGPVPTIIERDNNIPDLDVLIQEVEMAKEKVSKWS